jgi:hypothetical protein
MKYLIPYNENNKYNSSSLKSRRNIDEFIKELDKELKTIGFEIKLHGDYSICIGEIIEIERLTYMSFYSYTDLIEELKKKCNEILDNDKSSWSCSDLIKDNYDLLCMTILTFLDEKNYI